MFCIADGERPAAMPNPAAASASHGVTPLPVRLSDLMLSTWAGVSVEARGTMPVPTDGE